jgi:RNA-directed DNA polymerase
MVKRFEYVPCAYPVIMLIDNDDGAKEIFSVVKNVGGPTITLDTLDPFYHLFLNLYLVKTPEPGGGNKSCIEGLFDPALLKTIIDGKTFDPAKDQGPQGKATPKDYRIA